jgi:UDP-N-acetyl-D-galactosamine dehydrogenase
MGAYVVTRLIKAMVTKGMQINEARVLIMGLSFKENCPDLRNTRVIDIINELSQYNCNIDVYDPWVSVKESKEFYDVDLINEPPNQTYDAIVLAVAHEQFKKLGIDRIKTFAKAQHIIFDLKYLFDAASSDLRL